MFIVSCILSVTNMSEEELAEFVGITKKDVIDYLNGEEIPKKIRERFATMFSFPSFYFDVDTNENDYFKRIMKDTIKEEWENNKPQKYVHEITDEEIVASLINAYDLLTHKKFDNDHILNNKYVKDFLRRCFLTKKEDTEKEIEKDEKVREDNISSEPDLIYDKLLKWRHEKSIKEHMKEYMIISDKVLKNIISTPINEEKDLLKVSGIGLATFGKYGQDIYEIVKDKDKIEVLDM